MGYQAEIRDSDVIDGLSIRFLKLFGMWRALNDYRTTGKKSIIIKLHIFGSLMITVPYVVFQVQSFFTIQFDIQKVTFVNLHPLPALQMCCRMLLFWFHMDRVCRLYDMIRKDFINIPEYMRDSVRELYIKTNRTFNVTCLVIFIWNAGIEFIFIVFPKVSVDYVQHHTGSMAAVKTGRKKILSGWFPCPMDEYPYYEIIYVYEAFCLLWAATLLNVYFCMFYQVLMCLYAQFTVLGARLSNLKLDFPDFGLSKRHKNIIQNCNYNLYQELYESLRDHQKLLRYTDDLRKFYNPLVTVTLGIGILLLFMGAVQILLGKTSDPSFLFQLFQIFSFQFIEVSLFCFGSSRIESASTDLQFAIYCSDWYKADVRFRRAAQMLMIRTRKSSTLTAIVMYPVNLETLGAIVQFTYSAAALMSGMVN
ncbi:odorant receptor 10-like isoform X2 [Halyomorpha halys]|uniref:odorant receptor 10-like isoform X2 n=1 Tax=Halyomorpha halys TaxID=286706 RepID=UPI0006D4DBDB|nr:Odorant receptor 61 [Halyomorpha halys]